MDSSKKLCELGMKKIVEVNLGDTSPHLLLTFDTGEVLFINGHHDTYECWQVGVSNTENDEEVWEVVACPGDSLAIWVPVNI